VAKKKQPKNSGMRARLMKVFQNKRFLSMLALMGLLTGVFFWTRYFLLNDSFFTITDITINGQNDVSFTGGREKLNDMYLRRNVLSIDLDHATVMIAESFPQLKSVEIRRIMPNTLDVDVMVRRPVAIIGTGNKVMVDREAVVVTPARIPVDIVRITGINFFLNRPRPGEKIKARQVIQALSLLDLLDRKNITGRYDVLEIDVSDRNDLCLEVEGVRVKMGEGDFVRKISRLQEMLEDPGINMKGVEYIDLRFEEPVISPK